MFAAWRGHHQGVRTAAIAPPASGWLRGTSFSSIPRRRQRRRIAPRPRRRRWRESAPTPMQLSRARRGVWKAPTHAHSLSQSQSWTLGTARRSAGDRRPRDRRRESPRIVKKVMRPACGSTSGDRPVAPCSVLYHHRNPPVVQPLGKAEHFPFLDGFSLHGSAPRTP